MSATPQRTHRDPFAAMLRGAFLPTVVVGPVAVVVAAVVGGGRSALGAFLGFTVAIAFFALGLYVMRRLDSAADPFRFLASALAVFFGQLIFLLLVILWLQGADWLDGTAFGLAALAVALVWQVFQVVAYVRTRRLVFDAPSESGQDGGPHA
jgi:ATP synthase protein I